MPQAITELAGHTIYVGGMAPDKFVAVLNAFGPLPDEGQHELAQRLVGAVGVYRLETRTERPQPAEDRERLTRIVQAAGRLLEHLGVDDPQALSTDLTKAQPHSRAESWLLVELYKTAMERRPATATLSAHERWRALLLLLSDLKEAAERCVPMTSQWSPREGERRRRGGKLRQGPEPKGRLLHKLFETYGTLRLRFPESGPPLACDESLRGFVRAGFSLAASSAPPFIGTGGVQYELADKACGLDFLKVTTDAALRKAFQRWLGPTIAKGADDLGVVKSKRSK